ncbi:uncharacterized protein LOC100370411 [Saccoglossus kowalevskii]|uniref:Uncharacterized protein LOC100370411 n=1 Tax=Saccoglossus kowalevskii TaxID=10224 RepID=A0ABM0MCL6_SACKO|nr:PREDICTED: uncharacterized protein LOC100370411 [Saccoglossus kowalevskii]
MDVSFRTTTKHITFIWIVLLTIMLSKADTNAVSGSDSSSTSDFDCYFCSTSSDGEGVEGVCGEENFSDGDLLRYGNCAGVCTKNVIYAAGTDEVLRINRLCEGSCPGYYSGHCNEASHGLQTCTYCCSGHLCNASFPLQASFITLMALVLPAMIVAAMQ